MGKKEKKEKKIKVETYNLKCPISDGIHYYASESHSTNMACIIGFTKSKIDFKSGELTKDTKDTISVPTRPVLIIRQNNMNSSVVFGVTNILHFCLMKKQGKMRNH